MQMQLKIARQELLEKLSNIQSIVEKRSTMPILSHFLLEAAPGGCTITATDIETAVREPVKAEEVREAGRLCIPARKLFEIIKELDSDVSLSTADSLWLTVGSGRSSFKLACLAPEEFPAWPEMTEAEEFAIPSSMLLKMIEKTLFSAGESDTRYTLNGLLFHIVGGRLTVVGTDGHRLALISRELSTPPPSGEEKKIIVPRKTTAELRKFLGGDDDVTIVLGKNHILFRIGAIQFLARLIEGTYPNYQQVVPVENERKIAVSRDALTRALRRVSVISKDRSNAIRVDINPGALTLSSSNPDLGEASDEVAIEYADEPLSIGYNARYMLDALSAMSGETIRLEVKDQLSPTLLRETEDESYKCVVMPMRI